LIYWDDVYYLPEQQVASAKQLIAAAIMKESIITLRELSLEWKISMDDVYTLCDWGMLDCHCAEDFQEEGSCLGLAEYDAFGSPVRATQRQQQQKQSIGEERRGLKSLANRFNGEVRGEVKGEQSSRDTSPPLLQSSYHVTSNRVINESWLVRLPSASSSEFPAENRAYPSRHPRPQQHRALQRLQSQILRRLISLQSLQDALRFNSVDEVSCAVYAVAIVAACVLRLHL
jgi:hypothetical protein